MFFLVSLETCCSCRLYHIYFDIKCFWKFFGYICRSTNLVTFVVFVVFFCVFRFPEHKILPYVFISGSLKKTFVIDFHFESMLQINF